MMNAIYNTDTTIDWIGVSRKFVWAMVIAASFSMGAWCDSVFHGTAYLPAIRAEAAKAPAAVASANCFKEKAQEATTALEEFDPSRAASLPKCPPPPKTTLPLRPGT